MACPYSDKPYHKNGSCSQCAPDGRLVPCEKAYWQLTLARLGLGPVCEEDLNKVNTGEYCPACKSAFHYALNNGRRECSECGTEFSGPTDRGAPRFDCPEELQPLHSPFRQGDLLYLDEVEKLCE